MSILKEWIVAKISVQEGLQGLLVQLIRVSGTFQTNLPGPMLAIPITEQPWRGLGKQLQGYSGCYLNRFCFCSSWLTVIEAWTVSVL